VNNENTAYTVPAATQLELTIVVKKNAGIVRFPFRLQFLYTNTDTFDLKENKKETKKICIDHLILKTMNQSCNVRLLSNPGSKAKWFNTFKVQNSDNTAFLRL
jgi:hypothetical protein